MDDPSTTPWTDLRGLLTGTLCLPGEQGYALAEPWNRAITMTPAAVVAAADADDIARTVRFAGEHGLRVAVQSTGHGAVPVDGVVLVHTGRLDECVIDAHERTAHVGAGVTWQPVLDAAAPHGLTAVAGSSTSVGVVGYLTGGGIGPLAANFGISSDHVRALDVVTGDGQLRHVTATEHPDLFWGLRGGKATLGIVTAVDIDLAPLARVHGGCLFFDGADSAAVLHAWATWSAELPHHATTSIAMVELPDSPQLPPAIAGKRTIAVRFASVAAAEVAEPALAPIRAVATPLLDGVGEIPAENIGHIHADPTHPLPAYDQQTLLRSLPADAVDALLGVAGPDSGTPLMMVELRRLGGTIGRQPEHPGAIDHRDAAYALDLIGVATPQRQQAIADAAAKTIAALDAWSLHARFVNFGASDDPAEIARAFTPDTRRRLADLAQRYDPAGVLAVGQVVR